MPRRPARSAAYVAHLQGSLGSGLRATHDGLHAELAALDARSRPAPAGPDVTQPLGASTLARARGADEHVTLADRMRAFAADLERREADVSALQAEWLAVVRDLAQAARAALPDVEVRAVLPTAGAEGDGCGEELRLALDDALRSDPSSPRLAQAPVLDDEAEQLKQRLDALGAATLDELDRLERDSREDWSAKQKQIMAAFR